MKNEIENEIEIENENEVQNPMIDRIEEIVKAKSKNLSDFSSKVEISIGTLRSITKRKSVPGGEIIQKILFAFPEIDSDWLIRGIGQMHSDINKEMNQVKEESEFIQVIKRERDLLMSSIEKLERDKERLWTMLLETTGKKFLSNEPQRVVKLANTDFQTAA